MIRKVLMLGVVVAAAASGAGAEVWFVPARDSVVTTAPLAEGQWYVIEACGIYVYKEAVQPEKIADAEWAYTYIDGVWGWFETPGGKDLDLYIDGSDISMMGTEDGVTFLPHVFSPNHIYRVNILGQGIPIELSIYDERYDDNSGGLDVTIRPAVTGDTNVDDVVDARDYDNLIAQFGGPPADHGADFNGDGTVDLADFAIQRANFGAGGAAAPVDEFAPTVPEPATLVIIAMGSLAVIRPRLI